MVQVGGNPFDASCTCSPDTSSIAQSQCNPQEMSIIIDKKSKTTNRKEVEKFIGPIKNLTWTKITETHFADIDGRNKVPSLTTPGGDMGEFILALHVFQNYFKSPTPLTYARIENALKGYLGQMVQDIFYMATDSAAVDNIKEQANDNDVNILQPPARLVDTLLSKITQPENIGSIHLKMMMKSPNDYKISKTLVQNAIKAFYSLLWKPKNSQSGVKLKLDVLTGSPNEEGFLTLRPGAICTTSNDGPLLAPQDKNGSYYVADIDSVQTRRAQMAYYFSKIVGALEGLEIATDTFFNDLNRWGTSFLEVTGTKIGADLPFYSIAMT